MCIRDSLRYARIYISTLDKTRETEVLKGLKSAAGFLRRELGRALQLRYTPAVSYTHLSGGGASLPD